MVWPFLIVSIIICVSFLCLIWYMRQKGLKNRRLNGGWRSLGESEVNSRFEADYKKKIVDTPFQLKEYLMKDLVLGRKLGSGSFSDVYQVNMKDNLLDVTDIAGKIIKENVAVTLFTFFQEATLQHIASRKCNYIVKALGIVMHPRVILMEYYKNGSLDLALLEDHKQHVNAEGEFTILLRLQFIFQLCKAVTHLHRNHIVHRDLASRNLLLSNDRKSVVLADFSLARSVDLTNANSNSTYTAEVPKTSPPETWVSSGKRSFGLKTDVWLLGMTMWEIINKRPILDDLTELKNLVGTEALIPRRILRDDIYIG